MERLASRSSWACDHDGVGSLLEIGSSPLIRMFLVQWIYCCKVRCLGSFFFFLLLAASSICFTPLQPSRFRNSRYGSHPEAPLFADNRPMGNDPQKNRSIKPSRFSQTMHGPSVNRGEERKKAARPRGHWRPSSPVVDKNRMWKSKQSIEELEEALAKRWGTDSSVWKAKDLEDYEDYLGDGSADESSIRARPVLDPWDRTKAKMKPQRGDAYDYDYDENDDSRDMDDKGSDTVRTKSPLSVDHLIANNPAGGRGKIHLPEVKPSFFFQRPSPLQDERPSHPVQPKVPIDAIDINKEMTLRSRTASSSNNIPKVEPVLDANGDPMYLTTLQAKRNFETLMAADNQENLGAKIETGHSESEKEKQPSWQDLGIRHLQLIQNLHSMGCSQPIAVQSSSIPILLNEKRDAVIGFYTGSGKTLAFLTPVLERLLTQSSVDVDVLSRRNELSVVIVAPGRELASQIVAVARDLVRNTELTVMMAIGGTAATKNWELIRKRKPNILVGTPGRLAELIVGRPDEKGGRLKLPALQTVILDEFDALLEYKAHADPTNALLQALRRRHRDKLQVILCSATAGDMAKSAKLQQVLREGYCTIEADHDDSLVTKDSNGKARVSRTVIHGVVHVPHRRLALDTLRRILHTDPIPQQILVFVENSRKVEIMVEKLGNMGIIAAPLHGGRGSDKTDRAEVNKALRDGYVGLVVATELAARGLDAPLLSHVINFDLPTDPSHYAHRAGRCGRGGRPGVVINMTTDPKERSVPGRFAKELGIVMYRVDVANGRLNIVDSKA